MLGLVLEGGGARGAYEIGAVRAYYENGYKFDGAVGTSIGSINAAVIAQGDFDRALEIWESLRPETLFPEDEKLIEILSDKSFDLEDIPRAAKKIGELIKNGGLDTKHIKELLESFTDEEKLRESDMDFGLVTYSVTDRKRMELFKDDIPKGHLVNYLLASSMLPVFKQEKLMGKYFADGGYVDVCPYNMLIDRGYDELVVIRVFGTGLTRKVKSRGVKIQMVVPSDKLGNMLDFSPETIKNAMTMGYFDAQRVIKGYKGRKYYILPQNESYYFRKLINIDAKYLRAIGNILELPRLPGKRMLFDGIIPVICASLALPENYTYEEFVIAAVESVALSKGIDRFEVMSFEELLSKVRDAVYIKPDKKYTEITFPYRNPTKNTPVFRLPPLPLPTSYSYKIPGDEKLGNALEIFVRAICE